MTDLTEFILEAIENVHDMDVTLEDYAKAAAKAVTPIIKQHIGGAFMDGFIISGEGWNGEYPFGCDESGIAADDYYQEKRDALVSKRIAAMGVTE